MNDPYQASIEWLGEQPAMQFHPAYVAGQIVDRNLTTTWSYQSYLPWLESMAGTITDLDENIVAE